jgi:heme/copper-type cytochrome/quinol oxidase subunit 2
MLWLVDHPLAFFVATLALLIASTRIGVAARVHGHNLTSADRAEFDLVRNAMFTLLGLMVGFAISMAVSRYDLRKSYEEAEANAIGTEYLRLDLMPTEIAAATRALLGTYVHERISFYQDREPKQEKNDAATVETMNALWAAIAPEGKARQTPIMALVASGMNDVLNSQGYTLAAWRNRLPIEVWMLLILIAAGCNFLIGFGAERLSPTTHAILPVTAALAFLLIADVEGPRNGFVQVQPVNLQDVAAAMREK